MIDKLEMFIAVAKVGHFGRAADQLGITQPTLSTGIKNLEEQLGVKLIFRGSRYGGLTPEGQSALNWARRIVSDTRQLKEEMRFKRHGLSGQLRIAVIPTALTWAARLTSRFCESHPKARFTLLSRPSIEILAMMDNLDIDAGITYLDSEPTGKVSAEPLYRESYRLVCASGSPFAGRASVRWQELQGQKLCLLTPDMQNRRIINRHFHEAGVNADALIESNSTVVLISAVESGGWLTVLPTDIATFLTEGKDLALIPFSESISNPSVGLIAPYREPHTPILQELLNEARRISELD
ncbi:MAG: LysR family transcriptional regulator [Sneathiella sp.]|jgi:DNA-binding transcriptional LysR family regulator|uniref:LysR family transcriptional regulator n=1 Tax=Sneathiella sp. TaxID=1964365 RepID=UPI000C512BBA|nr:LysR family transcriptional regulator [Sneathiella sp.]MAL77804.1 LysR family transcriptional regulator [Sneathiella sp.]